MLSAGIQAETQDSSDVSSISEYGYWSNFYRIPAAAAGEIFTLEPDKLKRNVLALGAVGLVYTQDEAIRDHWMDTYTGRAMDKVGDALFEVGSPDGAMVLHGATAATALVFQDDYLMDTTFLSLQSVLISQLFAESSKRITGRERPRDANGDSNLWGTDGMSFFSGHASGAFASMTVFAERYRDQPVVYWGAYTLAVTTSLSRINEEAHWASDTLMGALVGYGVGQLTLRYSPFKESDGVLLPVIGEGYQGVYVVYRF